MMRICLIGANSQIGHHLVNLLSNNDEYSVKAMVRKEEQAKALRENGVDRS